MEVAYPCEKLRNCIVVDGCFFTQFCWIERQRSCIIIKFVLLLDLHPGHGGKFLIANRRRRRRHRVTIDNYDGGAFGLKSSLQIVHPGTMSEKCDGWFFRTTDSRGRTFQFGLALPKFLVMTIIMASLKSSVLAKASFTIRHSIVLCVDSRWDKIEN